MRLQRYIILLLIALCAPALGWAQLRFAADKFDFGTIRETDGEVSHIFEAENCGQKPVVILQVVTTCGCTVPEYSRKPILPGEKTSIKVVFDPANRSGIFNKELGVYSSERKKIATLTITGSITPREKSVRELYPLSAGNGVRLSESMAAFTYIYKDIRKSTSIGCVNTSSHPVTLSLESEESSGYLSIDYPRTLSPNERAEITFTYLVPAACQHFGTLRDALHVKVDGRSNGTLLMTHAISIDNPRDMPKGQEPRMELSKSDVRFGSIAHSSPVHRQVIELKNSGKGVLKIRAIESKIVSLSLRAGDTLRPGENRRVEILLDPAATHSGVMSEHVILITNDPLRPMRRLRVTAVIND